MATQFSGGTYTNNSYTASARSDHQKYIKTALLNSGWTNVAQASGQGPGNVGNFTVTIASPGVVTMTGHGFLGGEKVILQTTGALPTGLSVNTVYYVKYIDADTFNLATTLGGANINTSGSQSGTHTLNTESVLLQSLTQTNVTNPVRIRLKDNRGTCIEVSVENQAGTVAGGNSTTAGGGLISSASPDFRIIATKYWFVVMQIGGTAVHTFVMAGMLYIPSFISGVTDHGFMLCNHTAEGDGATRSSFRTTTDLRGASGTANSQLLLNGSIFEQTNSATSGIGTPVVLITIQPSFAGTSGYRWSNDDINTSDVLLTSGVTTNADEGKIKGQFFDMIYIAEAFSMDATDSFNGHNWYNLTSNNTGNPRGGMWVATS